MKKFILPLLAAILTIGCKPDMTPKEFIEDMYNNRLYENYSFLKKHCTREMLNKLSDAYDYDGEGYATWLFRSGMQDGVNDKYRIISIKEDGEWFDYEGVDMGIFFKRSIRLTVKGSRYIIEDVCGLNTVRVQEFAELIHDPDVVCIDTRSAKEYAKGHIPGAINISGKASTIAQQVKDAIGADKTIAIYGRTRELHSSTALQLAREGFKGYEMLGGFDFWPAMGYPVESKAAVELPAGQRPAEISLIKK